MRHLAFGVVVALVVGVGVGSAFVVDSANQRQDERALVGGVVRDYFEGWYTGDADRMGRSLHPDMVKRDVEALPSGRQVVQSATRDLMIEMTRAGGGSKTPPERRNIVVDVLEVSGDIAIARASSFQYLEYVSLARCNGQWTIINILWRFKHLRTHRAEGSGCRPTNQGFLNRGVQATASSRWNSSVSASAVLQQLLDPATRLC